ncbi:MAG: MFS transporter [Verrucomicrobia bacterium]|nr:MFS transporter [Verrucomicrobiota bacterium]
MQTSPDRTDSAAAVPARERVAYGFGVAGISFPDHAVSQNANFLYNVALGLSPLLIGTVGTACRLFDAFLDPLLGHLSDNCRSHLGRRRPFILGGGLAVAAMFALFFNPPGDLASGPLGWFYGLTLFGFYIALSTISVAYLGLLAELTPSPAERARILGTQYRFRYALALVAVWAFSFAQMPALGGTRAGFRVFGVLGAVLIASATLVVFFRVRERFADRVSSQPAITLAESFRATVRIEPLRWLVPGVICFLFAGNLVSGLGPYLVLYYVNQGDLGLGSVQIAVSGTLWTASSFLIVGPAVRFANRRGRRVTYLLAGGAVIAGSLLKWVCFTPGAGWWVVLPSAVIGPGWNTVMLLVLAESADLADWDELQTGWRREGVISAVINWVQKTGQSVSYIAAGAILTYAGFDIALGAGQTPATFLRLRLLFTLVPCLFVVLALWALARYPVNEASMREVREQLDRRSRG